MTKQKGTGSKKFATAKQQIFVMDDSETDYFFPLLTPPLLFSFSPVLGSRWPSVSWAVWATMLEHYHEGQNMREKSTSFLLLEFAEKVV